jgi:hypothetical protein
MFNVIVFALGLWHISAEKVESSGTCVTIWNFRVYGNDVSLLINLMCLLLNLQLTEARRCHPCVKRGKSLLVK